MSLLVRIIHPHATNATARIINPPTQTPTIIPVTALLEERVVDGKVAPLPESVLGHVPEEVMILTPLLEWSRTTVDSE